MAIRWVLTVIAIVVFMDHSENCKDDDLPQLKGNQATLPSTNPPVWGALCVQKITQSYLKFRTKSFSQKKLAKRSIREAYKTNSCRSKQSLFLQMNISDN